LLRRGITLHIFYQDLVVGVVLLVQGVGGITKCTKDIFGNIKVGNESPRARPGQQQGNEEI